MVNISPNRTEASPSYSRLLRLIQRVYAAVETPYIEDGPDHGCFFCHKYNPEHAQECPWTDIEREK